MKHVFLTLVMVCAAFFTSLGFAQQRGPSSVNANNAPTGALNDTANTRNLYRQKILNEVLRKRGSPAAVSAQVYSLSFFNPFMMLWNKWETTFGWFNRGLYAKMPFGQKQHYSGLHPRYVEYRFHDKDGDFLYAQCFLQFYTSRSIPGRIFIRSYHCSEQDFVRTTQGYKGFHFAVVADLNRGKIGKFKDLTAEWLKDATLDSETKFVSYLTDPALFEDPNRQQRGGGGGGLDDDDGPPTN